MTKYFATAVCLKCFSSTPLTRSLYRGLGNRIGGNRRSTGKMPAYYPKRIKRMLRLAETHGVVKNGDRILELGTGWLHWEALTLRLFFDIEAVLYDVWDNRQFGGLKNYVRQLPAILNSPDFELSKEQLARANSLMDSVLKTSSLEELYKLLNFTYVVEPSGSLKRFPDRSFDLVVSAGVLEHVDRSALPILIPETNRVLKPNGWGVHSIDTSDHLSHYDRSVSAKRYIGYSESTWKRLFENRVQYINRFQRSDWLKLFRESGFELVEEDASSTDIAQIRVAQAFANYERRDLETTSLRLVFRKAVGV